MAAPGRFFRGGTPDSDSDSSEGAFAPSAPPTPPRECDVEVEQEKRLRLTRRANAQLITSNVIPDMNSPDEMPYCVWYPGLATEDTYRSLARRYPALRYQVGRACAVAGYTALYFELDLLPEVSIAEEARESGNDGSTAIFEHIMSQPIRYAVMDDYERTVNLVNPRAGACLNGDTAISPPPDKRSGDGDQHWIWPRYFDITEEWSDLLAHEDRPWDPSRAPGTYLPRKFTHLLHSPLPPDLPTTLKDNLIVMAAYEGNVDRYHRLRRPFRVKDEREAIIRGIYHSTSFAMYFVTDDTELAEPADWQSPIGSAITARRIMVNDLSHITEDLEDDGRRTTDFPQMIWHPLFPRPETLMELIRRRPRSPPVRQSVALACIAADYPHIYDEIKPWPDWHLWQQALKSPNPHYREDIKRRAASGEYPGVAPEEFPECYCDWYPQEAKDLRPTSTTLSDLAHGWGLVEPVWGGFPNERWEIEANSAEWELYMCSPDELRDEAEKESDGCLPLYALWKYDTPAWRRSLPWYQGDKGKEGTDKSQGSQETAKKNEGTESKEKTVDN